MGERIELNESDRALATWVGAERFAYGSKHCQDKAKGNIDKKQMSIDGALAEMAFAKHSGLYWPPTVRGKEDRPDVPPFEVRGTRNIVGGNLLIKPDDRRGLYVLVLIHTDWFEVVGYSTVTTEPMPVGHPWENNQKEMNWRIMRHELREFDVRKMRQWMAQQ